ncbi:MAG TPA: hypothetical protein VF163_18740 [Micromonosporaceae bacterium]
MTSSEKTTRFGPTSAGRRLSLAMFDFVPDWPAGVAELDHDRHDQLIECDFLTQRPWRVQSEVLVQGEAVQRHQGGQADAVVLSGHDRAAVRELRFLASDRRRAAQDESARQRSSDAIRWGSIEAEADRLHNRYPLKPDLVMPTSLGNMLRRYEVGPGEPPDANALPARP